LSAAAQEALEALLGDFADAVELELNDHGQSED
jgi:hypothetical protein